MLVVHGLRRSGLAPLDLTLGAGECVALMGPSGAGKTLLLRAIADLDPTEGEVVLDERPRESVPGPAWRRLVAYVSSEPGWWAEIAVDHFEDRAAALRLAAAFALSEALLDSPVARLSTGERQRLALARALERAPRVLLLDEPTAALDAAARAVAERRLKAELARGAAILFTTHDEEQARRLATRRLTMHKGRVEEPAP